MVSPFRRHQQRVLGALASAAAAPSNPMVMAPDPDSESGQEYAVLVAVLHDNLRKLQDVDSHEARVPMKQGFADEFIDWIDGVLEADLPVQDEILITNMVWAIDYDDYHRALQLGEFALKHNLVMPERYQRTVACFLREEIAQKSIDDPDKVEHSVLVSLDELTAEPDMPDPAKAKLNKALGRSWYTMAENFDASDETGPAGGAAAYAQAAIMNFERALQLDRGVGVKKDLERAQRKLRDLTADADEEE